jgi:hypothetical protein
MISISVYVALALLSAVLPMAQARDIPSEIVVFRGHYIEIEPIGSVISTRRGH